MRFSTPLLGCSIDLLPRHTTLVWLLRFGLHASEIVFDLANLFPLLFTLLNDLLFGLSYGLLYLLTLG